MRDLLSWNLSLGRWAGVHVRLHVFFVLFIIFALQFGSQYDGGKLFWYGVCALSILLVSVAAHEFGHCFAAWKVGGAADQALLWPLGGLAPVNISHDPHEELVTAVAGPATNLAICVITAPMLAMIATVDSVNLLALLNPLNPPTPRDSTVGWPLFLELVFWTNWLLLLVNLLPAFPLDGGRALRSLLWPKFDYRTAVLLTVRAAKLTAVGLWILAVLVRDRFPLYSVSPSLALALLGVFVFFGAKQEAERLHEHENDDPTFAYDFSQGYTSLEKHFEHPPRQSAASSLRRWLEKRRSLRQAQQQQREAEEEQRVDDILARLHGAGLHALSHEDRALLDRVSARYRNRQQR